MTVRYELVVIIKYAMLVEWIKVCSIIISSAFGDPKSIF
jgi:hypothetical protein